MFVVVEYFNRDNKKTGFFFFWLFFWGGGEEAEDCGLFCKTQLSLIYVGLIVTVFQDRYVSLGLLLSYYIFPECE